jgi:integrase
MPRSTPSIPKYSLHKPSGRARVRIGGRDIYLGAYGSPESKEAYNRVIAEHLAGGVPTARPASRPSRGPLSIAELILRYADHRKASKLSPKTFDKVDRPALRRLRKLYGTVPVSDFGPSSLRALQRRALVEEGLSRQYINKKLTPVIKRLFKWGLAQDLVSADVVTRLGVAEPIKMGEFGARETAKVKAVDDAVIEQTIADMEPIPADMVRVQRLTGMRPGEVCAMRWVDIETDGDIWVACPRALPAVRRPRSRGDPGRVHEAGRATRRDRADRMPRLRTPRAAHGPAVRRHADREPSLAGGAEGAVRRPIAFDAFSQGILNHSGAHGVSKVDLRWGRERPAVGRSREDCVWKFPPRRSRKGITGNRT